MKRKLIIAAILTLVAAASPAQDSTANTGLGQHTSATAVRMSIVNGLVQTYNNTRQLNMELDWNFLPSSDGLTNAAAAYAVQPITINISNSDLKNGVDWLSKLKSNPKDPQDPATNLRKALYLQDADHVSFGKDDKEKTATTAIGNFNNAWNKPEGWGFKLRSGSISIPDFLASQRDFFFLVTLLRSSGVSSAFTVSQAEVKGPNPRISADDITWEIKLYQLPLTKDQRLYRCSIRAKEQPFPVLFENGAQGSAKLSAKFTFIRQFDETGHPNDVLSGLVSDFLGTIITNTADLSQLPPNDAVLHAASDSLAPSSLETTLKLVGGVDLTDVVSRGLLGGSAQSSLISGGLFGRGKVTQVVGFSTDFWRRGRNAFGYALGGIPDDSNSLFTGLSAQFGDLTLIPGFIAAGTADGKKTVFKGALGVSFDLGRVFGMKKDNNYIVENPCSDPTWTPSDALYEDLGGFAYILDAASPNDLGITPRMALSWRIDEGHTGVAMLYPTDQPEIPTFAYVSRGDVVVSAPLGFNVYLVTGPGQQREVNTTIVGDLNPASAISGRTVQQVGTTVHLVTSDAVSLHYKLEPAKGFLLPTDNIDFAKLSAKLTAPMAAAVFNLLPTDIQSLLRKDPVSLSGDEENMIRTALNVVIAGPPLPNSSTGADAKKNSKRTLANRKALEAIVGDAIPVFQST